MKVVPTALDDLVANFREPVPGTPLTDEQAMQLAFAVAWQGLGRVSPNPLVGAVAVDASGRFLACGAHRVYGGPHAEVDMLQRIVAAGATERLDGATIFVTLEPCAHHGKTPPCAEALARLPIARVVYACQDPNPQVNGRGELRLRNAGIKADAAPSFGDICTTLNMPFLSLLKNRRPYVAIKIATTLNGAVARHGARKVWITGERARAYGHFLRGRYDAILVGSQTVLLDNPSLSMRHPRIPGRNPKRIILDPDLEVAGTSAADIALLQFAPTDVFWIIAAGREWTREQQRFLVALRGLGVHIVEVPLLSDQQFDLNNFLQQIMSMGVHSILVEGGAKTAQSFVAANLADHLHLFQAPVIWGGDDLVLWGMPLKHATAGHVAETQLTILKDDWLIDAPVIQ